jgi:hypothetical protein
MKRPLKAGKVALSIFAIIISFGVYVNASRNTTGFVKSNIPGRALPEENNTLPGHVPVLTTADGSNKDVPEGDLVGSYLENSAGFQENLGQVRDQSGNAAANVKYVYESAGMSIYLLNDGIAYQLIKEDKNDHSLYTHRVNVKLVGADLTSVSSEDQVAGLTSFTQYNVHGAGTYGKIKYRDVYPGIDWVIYIKADGKVKYAMIILFSVMRQT